MSDSSPGDVPRDEIRKILLEDWDPSNAVRFESSRLEYDGWIAPLWKLITSGGDEAQIIAFLREREAETMCFPGLGTQRLQRPARKLLALRRTPQSRLR
jgi:hypothetical protein